MSGSAFVGVFASAGPIIVAGDTVQSIWYQQAFLHQKDDARRHAIGKYESDCVRVEGR